MKKKITEKIHLLFIFVCPMLCVCVRGERVRACARVRMCDKSFIPLSVHGISYIPFSVTSNLPQLRLEGQIWYPTYARGINDYYWPLETCFLHALVRSLGKAGRSHPLWSDIWHCHVPNNFYIS